MSQTHPGGQTLSIAQHPFDSFDADVILRSSDNIDFRVFKCILSLASPVFKDMFVLGTMVYRQDHQKLSPSPQPPPVVHMFENSSTLDPLLRLVYPGSTPTLSSFDQAKDFLAAVAKYNMSETVTGRAKDIVVAAFLNRHHAVSIYALACLYGWQDLAEKAARETLKIKDLGRATGYVPELDHLSVVAYHRLLAYHHNCGTVARGIKDYVDDSWFEPPCLAYETPPDEEHTAYFTCTCPMALTEHEWVELYLATCSKELLYRPDPSTIQNVHFVETLRQRGERLCPRMPLHLHSLMDTYSTEIGKAISTLTTTGVEKLSWLSIGTPQEGIVAYILGD